jgi:hypothetical protein
MRFFTSGDTRSTQKENVQKTLMDWRLSICRLHELASDALKVWSLQWIVRSF